MIQATRVYKDNSFSRGVITHITNCGGEQGRGEISDIIERRQYWIAGDLILSRICMLKVRTFIHCTTYHTQKGRKGKVFPQPANTKREYWRANIIKDCTFLSSEGSPQHTSLRCQN